MAADNAAIVKRFYTELIAQGRLDAADGILTAGYVDHDVNPQWPGVEGFVAWLSAFDRAFRNRVVTVEEVTQLGAFVSVRWTAEVTQTGAFAGVPPTGKTLNVSGIGVFRVEDDQLAERWEYEIGPGLMRQLSRLAERPADRLDAIALFEQAIAVREAAAGARAG